MRYHTVTRVLELMFARVGNDDRHIQRSRFKVVGAEGAQLIGKMDGSNQGLQKDC